MYIRKKLHFDNLFSFSLASVTTATVHIKRKMFWLKATHLTQGLFGIQVSYFIICLYISNRVATAAFTDRVLIYHFDLCNRFDIACNCFMQSYFIGKLAFYFLQSRI